MATTTAPETYSSDNKAVRLLLADRTPMTTSLLADALGRHRRFQIVAATQHSAQILESAANPTAQVAVISSCLDEEPLKGLEVTSALRRNHPKLKVVILLDRPTREAVVEAFRAGARGVFCRTNPIKALHKCILSVHAGQVWANSKETMYLLEALSEERPIKVVDANGVALLSKREQDVLQHAVDGLRNREIADELNLSEHTVKNYMFRIFDKLGVSNRVEMILYALSQRSSSSPVSPTYEDGGNGGLQSGIEEDISWLGQGFQDAKLALAILCRDGRNVPQDKTTAYAWLMLAEESTANLRRSIIPAKEDLKTELSAAQIAEAERRAKMWMSGGVPTNNSVSASSRPSNAQKHPSDFPGEVKLTDRENRKPQGVTDGASCAAWIRQSRQRRSR